MAEPLLIFVSGGGPPVTPPPPQLEILIGVADGVSAVSGKRVAPATILTETWAGAMTKNWGFSGNTVGARYAFDTNIFNEGPRSTRITLIQDDTTFGSGFRSELQLKAVFPGETGISQIHQDIEYWWGFAHRLDPNWVVGKTDIVLAQLHGATGSPPLELRTGDSTDINFNEADGNFDVYRTSLSTNSGSPSTTFYNLGAFNPGVWEFWVFHFNLSLTSAGFLQVYRNRTLMVDVTGENIRDDQGNMFVKTGLYNAKWISPGRATNPGESTRITWVDSFRLRLPPSSFAEVDPTP